MEYVAGREKDEEREREVTTVKVQFTILVAEFHVR